MGERAQVRALIELLKGTVVNDRTWINRSRRTGDCS